MPEDLKDLDGQNENGSSGQPSDGSQTDWEARFKGLQRKYNLLVEQVSDKDDELAAVSSAKEQLEQQLNEVSVEKDTQLSEKDQKINQLTASLNEKELSVRELAAYQKKVDIVRELGHPELVKVINSVPNSDDEEVLKKAFMDIVELNQDVVQAREKQLLDGQSPGGMSNDAPPLPTTQSGWQEYVNKFPLGSDERKKAMDAWFNFNQKAG